MAVELIQSDSAFNKLKTEWNALLNNSASRVPFLRHEFLTSWWGTLGGGEWNRGDLTILLHRNSAGILQGIAPLFKLDERILLIGSYEISDYLDIISHQDHLDQVIEELLAFLAGEHFPNWQVLDLYNLLEDSPSLPIIKDKIRQAGYHLEEEVLQPAPYIPLPTSWRAYLEGLQPRYRSDIEKKLSNAENYFLPVTWYIVDDPAVLDQEMDDFLELMANHPEKDRFLTPAMVRQMKNLGQEAFQAGWLQLAFLQVGDIKAAGILNFDFADQIWIYNSGINPLFENISPGWVLLGHIIRWSIESGKHKLDFMRGDEAYKYQFGGVDKKVLRLRAVK